MDRKCQYKTPHSAERRCSVQVSLPHKCCNNVLVRSGFFHAIPALCLQPTEAPAASDTASESLTNNTWQTGTGLREEQINSQSKQSKPKIMIYSRASYLIISKSLWSDTLMFLAMFQERWIMGTIDLTLCNLFHSYRSTASLYWWAEDRYSDTRTLSAYGTCDFYNSHFLLQLPVRGPTFHAILLHQPIAWTQWIVPVLSHTKSPGRWINR